MRAWFANPLSRAAVVVAVVVIAVLVYFLRGHSDDVRYVTAPVTRGSVVRVVNATGTVNPVTTVQVGSFVSGPIQALYADFNSPVKAGQLIAKIDPRPFQVKVDESAAALANAKAQLLKDQANLAYAKVTYQRDRKLVAQNVISDDQLDSQFSTYQQAVAQVALDKANIEQQAANLKDAQVQLAYTNIVSPVNGTVVSRNVDVGQTVAASFQTPTLFLIAKDLTKMQVDSNVSESDIGNVRTAQDATFEVDAFPGRDFHGVVAQVRQAPITVQNVVTYDVVVDVANPELLLKPGMTANVTIVTARRDRALRVPVAAVRFSPRGVGHGSDGAAIAGGIATSADAAASPAPAAASAPSNRATVYLDGNDTLTPVRITTGLDDGSYVEVLSGQLEAGERVVTEAIRPQAGASRSPFRMR